MNKYTKTNWEWNKVEGENFHSYDGVIIESNGRIRWYSDGYPGYANGTSCTQSVSSFLKNGPVYKGQIPKEILKELTEQLKS